MRPEARQCIRKQQLISDHGMKNASGMNGQGLLHAFDTLTKVVDPISAD